LLTGRTGKRLVARVRIQKFCGYGSVVEHVLAKDETRVRFSLSAQSLKISVFLAIVVLAFQ
jgi:hypothetical protein